MHKLKSLYQLPVRVINWLCGASYAVACAAIVAVLVSMTYEVGMRYIFNDPTIWSFEICGYLFITMVCLAAAHIHRQDRHIMMEFISQYFPAKAATWIRLILSIMGLIYCAVITWAGGKYAMHAYHEGYYSNTMLHLPLFPTMLLIPLGFTLLGLQFLLKSSNALQSILGSRNEPSSS